MSVTLYQVGGSVRDELLGLKSKDIDFAVECSDYWEMREWLLECEFTLFLEQPEFMTIRARFPRRTETQIGSSTLISEPFAFAGYAMNNVTADFVVCRKDGHYTDARHPDSVGGGTILDDLKRRDFTMNAIAKRADGTLYDPFNGQRDIAMRRIQAVGDAYTRLREDPLRILRALRFAVTKGFELSTSVADAIQEPDLIAALVQSVSEERTREELHKMFKHNTRHTLHLLMTQFPTIGNTIFEFSNIWLRPTLEDR